MSRGSNSGRGSGGRSNRGSSSSSNNGSGSGRRGRRSNSRRHSVREKRTEGEVVGAEISQTPPINEHPTSQQMQNFKIIAYRPPVDRN